MYAAEDAKDVLSQAADHALPPLRGERTCEACGRPNVNKVEKRLYSGVILRKVTYDGIYQESTEAAIFRRNAYDQGLPLMVLARDT
jgi:hypothetical protein